MSAAASHGHPGDAAGAGERLIAPELVGSGPDGLTALIGGRCTACGALSFPRARVCTECLSLAVEAHALARRGRLYSYSVVHQAPQGWTVPYVLGYVDLDDGVRVLAHIAAAPERVAIDQRVALATGRVGTGPAGEPLRTYTFAPEAAP